METNPTHITRLAALINEAAELHTQGLPASAIAVRLGLTFSQLQQVVNLGIRAGEARLAAL